MRFCVLSTIYFVIILKKIGGKFANTLTLCSSQNEKIKTAYISVIPIRVIKCNIKSALVSVIPIRRIKLVLIPIRVIKLV